MLDKIKTKNLVVNGGKALDGLFTMLVGFSAKRFLKGVEAQAQAKVIEAKTGIEIRELLAEADREQQLAQQGRLISIIDQAAPQLGRDADPDKMDDEWRENFRAKARHVTTEDMQMFWGRLLAVETNNPGTVSKRAVNAVADMDRSDAELFTRLCRFVWEVKGEGKHIPIFDFEDSVYNSAGLSFEPVQNSASMGLVTISSTGFNVYREDDDAHSNWVFSYFGRSLQVPTGKGQRLNIGIVMLTDIGRQIASVVGSQQPIEGFYEYCRDKWLPTQHRSAR